MDIDIQNPVNCLHLIMKELKINQKIRNEVVDLLWDNMGKNHAQLMIFILPCTKLLSLLLVKDFLHDGF